MLMLMLLCVIKWTLTDPLMYGVIVILDRWISNNTIIIVIISSLCEQVVSESDCHVHSTPS